MTTQSQRYPQTKDISQLTGYELCTQNPHSEVRNYFLEDPHFGRSNSLSNNELRCSSCNCPISSSPIIENGALQKSLPNCDVPDNSYGNLKEEEPSHYQEHLEEYCTVICHRGDLNNCKNSLIDLHSYVNHLQAIHKVTECLSSNNGIFKLEHTLTNSCNADADWNCMFVRLYGQVFIPRLFLRFHILHAALSVIGPASEAETFSARISFVRPKDKRPFFDTVIPIVPIEVTDAEIAENWVHPVLTKSMLKQISISTDKNSKQSLTWHIQYQVVPIQNSLNNPTTLKR